MKKILVLLIMICTTSIVSVAQITGGFYSQNGSVYFMGTNNSGYKLGSITIRCVNSYLQQERTFTMNYMLNGSNFTVGEADGWTWQPGEQLFVTYSNGNSVYWIYQPTTYTNPSYDNQYNNNSSSNNGVIQERIRQLEWKLQDSQRSLSEYEARNNKNPSVSGGMLVNSQRQLVRTYQQQIQDLRRQLR